MDSITSIFEFVRANVLYVIYYGLLSIAGITALIVLLVNLFKGFFSNGETSGAWRWVKASAVTLLALLLMVFAPLIINSLITYGGGAAITPVS